MIELTNRQVQHILETLKQCQSHIADFENKEILMEDLVFAIQLIADNPSYHEPPSFLSPTTNPNLNKGRKR